MQTSDKITIQGAREHNLKNIDLEIPRNKLTVITGLSGSGKSSLAFDTIYAEGQRRYIETFSAYARQFLGNLERPDVDKITGLSPVISIEQKTTNKNPRSTVGTTTEIYDFLRLLFARAGEAYSYLSGEKMVSYTDEQILSKIAEVFAEKKTIILAPVVRSRKGHYKELFISIRKKGFLQVRINGTIQEISPGLLLDRYKTHNIEIVIDKLVVSEKNADRIKKAVDSGMHHGAGVITVLDSETGEQRFFSRDLMCPITGISYDKPAPNSFSFNSPQGACPDCNGLGVLEEISIKKLIPDKSKSIYRGAILPLGEYENSLIFMQLEAIAMKYGFTLKTPVCEIPEPALDIIINGSDEQFAINSSGGASSGLSLSFDGIVKFVERYVRANNKTSDKFLTEFFEQKPCPECKGKRLKKTSLWFRFAGKNISELSEMDINDFSEFMRNSKETISGRQKLIAEEIIKEIETRAGFLADVGLGYLSLNRNSGTLSGGESQRIRLASQIGSKLVNVLYILDEPSIGLHQRDNQKLINSLLQLRDTGNSVIVVEHDKDMMLHADYLIDMGPRAGKHGGEICSSGTPAEVMKTSTLTSDYLTGRTKIEIPQKRRSGNGKSLVLHNAKGNNLKSLTVEFPLGMFICVTGVSGSGKSTLINHTLHPILSNILHRSLQVPLTYEKLEGIENIDKVIDIDQSPIGRTPRSNPATYTKIFDEIRNLYEKLPESKIRAYKKGRFSFNVKGGRCETCSGAGVQTIEMNLMPDVYVICPDCQGKRYNRETLEVRYKGKSINDVLNMTIEEAIPFFESFPKISSILHCLENVGLGYITLGQQATTLSGGEAQRVKLAAELSKKDTGKTLYILDEPTTGLHFEDIKMLLKVLNDLVNKGNSVVVIEHNLDVIKVADYIIDIGKDGGKQGGELICKGTPEEVAENKESYTAMFLKEELR